jgi:GR25 family glycosyltransferase involved in LPS biosynthesis
MIKWDKAFLINLDDRPARLRLSTAELNRYNIPFVRFPGIRNIIGKEGCRASHIAIYRQCIQENINPLIIEDDIIMQPEFKDWPLYLEAVERHSKGDWDLIFFCRDTNHQGIIPEEPLIVWGPTMGMHFYIVNKRVLPKLITIASDIRHPFDWDILYAARASLIKAYCTAINLVCQDNTLGSDVSITGRRGTGKGIGGILVRGKRKCP